MHVAFPHDFDDSLTNGFVLVVHHPSADNGDPPNPDDEFFAGFVNLHNFVKIAGLLDIECVATRRKTSEHERPMFVSRTDADSVSQAEGTLGECNFCSGRGRTGFVSVDMPGDGNGGGRFGSSGGQWEQE